jgi:hypothetical protein
MCHGSRTPDTKVSTNTIVQWMAATYPLIVDRVEPVSTYPSDKGSGAGEAPANTGDGVRHARRANGELVTTRRSVAQATQAKRQT